MAASMHIEVDEEAAEQIRELAATLKKTPEETVEEVVTNGLHMLRRYASLLKKSETANIDEALAILNRGGNEPPVPGDELPEGYVPFEQRRRA